MMVGKKLKDLGIEKGIEMVHVAGEESVFPSNKFYWVDAILGPVRKSTREATSIDTNYGVAFWKLQPGAGHDLPSPGNVLITANNKDKRNIIFIATSYWILVSN